MATNPNNNAMNIVNDSNDIIHRAWYVCPNCRYVTTTVGSNLNYGKVCEICRGLAHLLKLVCSAFEFEIKTTCHTCNFAESKDSILNLFQKSIRFSIYRLHSEEATQNQTKH